MGGVSSWARLAVVLASIGASTTGCRGASTDADAGRQRRYESRVITEQRYEGTNCREMADQFGSLLARDVRSVAAGVPVDLRVEGDRGPRGRPTVEETVREVYIAHIARLAHEVALRRLRCGPSEMRSHVESHLDQPVRDLLMRSVARWGSSEPVSDEPTLLATLERYFVAFLDWQAVEETEGSS